MNLNSYESDFLIQTFVDLRRSLSTRIEARILAAAPSQAIKRCTLCLTVLVARFQKEKAFMAKTAATRKRVTRREWTASDVKELRTHSKARTPVTRISRAMKRTPGALRQKARHLGFSIGHRTRPSKRRGLRKFN
jgi:hypothetical protein